MEADPEFEQMEADIALLGGEPATSETASSHQSATKRLIRTMQTTGGLASLARSPTSLQCPHTYRLW